jgi:8-oxo-dGTP pyrophosphatase MutT (NUDIX family)
MASGAVPVDPVPAATALIVRDGASGTEVVMVRRPPGGMFGDLWVFPGGVVDRADGAGRGEDAAARRAAVRESREEVGMDLDAEKAVFVSRWITPVWSPRRYDTRFYLIPAGDELEPAVTPGEVEEGRWVAAAEALRLHGAGEWEMILPTLEHLRWLDDLGSVEAAARAAGSADDQPYEPLLAEDGSLIARLLPR